MNQEQFDKTKPHSRMSAIQHFFSLQTTEQKKEYSKLTEADRQEIATELRDKHGYNITDVAK